MAKRGKPWRRSGTRKAKGGGCVRAKELGEEKGEGSPGIPGPFPFYLDFQFNEQIFLLIPKLA